MPLLERKDDNKFRRYLKIQTRAVFFYRLLDFRRYFQFMVDLLSHCVRDGGENKQLSRKR